MLKQIVLLLAATLLLCSGSLFASEPMTAEEKQALLDHLDRTAANFRKSIEGVSEAQWTFKPAPDRWSLAECAEHIVSSESFIRERFAPSLETPASAELLAGARREQQIEKLVTDRTTKFNAPEPLVPSQKYRTAAEALAAFDAERQKTIELARSSGDLRSFAMASPSGPLDAYGWFTFLSSHTARHTQQIEEVKTAAGYPASTTAGNQ